jgi:hypothetical protein
LFVFYIFPVGLTPTFLGPNETSYGFLALALYERQSFNVDTEVKRFWATEDLAQHGGHFYTNKAPGLSLWLAAFTPIVDLVTPGRIKLIELTYYGRVLALTLPFVLFLYAFGRFLERLVSPATAWGIVLAYGLGTNAGVYASMLINHNLTAMAHFAAFYALWRGGRRSALIAGLASGFGVLLEMPTIILFAALGISAVVLAPSRERLRAAALFAAGALPMAAILLAYNWTCFGNPLVVSYMRDQKILSPEGGRAAISPPSAVALFGLFASPSRGLFFHSPWMLLAIGGAFAMRRLSAAREQRLLAGMLAGCAALALFISGFLYWHGSATAGPRYLIATYPYLATLAALTLEHASARWRPRLVAAFAATLVISIAVNTLIVMIFPVIPWVPDGLLLNVVSGFAIPYLREGLGTYTIANHLGATLAASQAMLAGLAILAVVGYAAALLFERRSRGRADRPAETRGGDAVRSRDGRRGNVRWAPAAAGTLAGALLFFAWLQLGVRETPQTHRWRDEVGAPWRHRDADPPTRVPLI